jgi:hypothetical protein
MPPCVVSARLAEVKIMKTAPTRWKQNLSEKKTILFSTGNLQVNPLKLKLG